MLVTSEVYRYRAVLMRARFDENRKKDLGEGRRLLACGQQELFETKHFQPKNCKCIYVVVSTNIHLMRMSLQLPIAPAAVPMSVRWSHQIGCLIIGIHWRRRSIQSTLPNVNSARKNMWLGGRSSTANQILRTYIIKNLAPRNNVVKSNNCFWSKQNGWTKL